MTKTWTGKRVVIRKGWHGVGRQGTAVGEPVFVLQDWLPVNWDDEEDPDFHKLAGLTFAPDKPYDPWDGIQEAFYFDDDSRVRALLSDANALLTMVPTLYEIRMQATRMNRASDERVYLVVDLERIKKLADKAIATLDKKPHLKVDLDLIDLLKQANE